MNQLKLKSQTMGWTEMSKLTGLHRNTLLNISRYNHKQVLGMNVGTLIVLQEKLGVSMLAEFKNYHLVVGQEDIK